MHYEAHCVYLLFYHFFLIFFKHDPFFIKRNWCLSSPSFPSHIYFSHSMHLLLSSFSPFLYPPYSLLTHHTLSSATILLSHSQYDSFTHPFSSGPQSLPTSLSLSLLLHLSSTLLSFPNLAPPNDVPFIQTGYLLSSHTPSPFPLLILAHILSLSQSHPPSCIPYSPLILCSFPLFLLIPLTILPPRPPTLFSLPILSCLLYPPLFFLLLFPFPVVLPLTPPSFAFSPPLLLPPYTYFPLSSRCCFLATLSVCL